MPTRINFLTEKIPDLGETYEICPGILWVRMPLPFRLDHINLWMIEEGDGWTIIDSGINDVQTKRLWEVILNEKLQGKPVSRLICTHAHPDHLGLAGWFNRKYGSQLVITREEWSFGRMFAMGKMRDKKTYRDYFLRVGGNPKEIADYETHINSADKLYTVLPSEFLRIKDGDTVNINGMNWKVIIGLGHSHEHACLYCSELEVLIGGDQILPKITPTIMVHAYEPEANPLLDFFESNSKLRSLPNSVHVLPSHERPFIGLHDRLDQYIKHHNERLDILIDSCHEPLSGIEISRILFPQKLDHHGKFFALGETMAHIRYLENEGQLVRVKRVDKVERYVRV